MIILYKSLVEQMDDLIREVKTENLGIMFAVGKSIYL